MNVPWFRYRRWSMKEITILHGVPRGSQRGRRAEMVTKIAPPRSRSGRPRRSPRDPRGCHSYSCLCPPIRRSRLPLLRNTGSSISKTRSARSSLLVHSRTISILLACATRRTWPTAGSNKKFSLTSSTTNSTTFRSKVRVAVMYQLSTVAMSGELVSQLSEFSKLTCCGSGVSCNVPLMVAAISISNFHSGSLSNFNSFCIRWRLWSLVGALSYWTFFHGEIQRRVMSIRWNLPLQLATDWKDTQDWPSIKTQSLQSSKQSQHTMYETSGTCWRHLKYTPLECQSQAFGFTCRRHDTQGRFEGVLHLENHKKTVDDHST